MTPRQVVKYFGGPKHSVALAARRLDCTSQAVYKWLLKGRIPLLRQHAIQELTEGKLKAERL
jgi:transposase-like protein